MGKEVSEENRILNDFEVAFPVRIGTGKENVQIS